MTSSSRKEVVAVAMSGGVDSSVAACLLKEQGYEVLGVTMKLWDAECSGELNTKSCCTLDSSLDAKRVCDRLGVPHYTLDMTEDFDTLVVQPFYDEYRDACTPNPCVNCNSHVKWGALWEKVRAVGADCMATGHYASVRGVGEKARLVRGRDRDKDQSYFLWGIPQNLLARTLFPLAMVTKPEVRQIARLHSLKTADKQESQDICFIPDGDKNRFLREKAKKQNDSFVPGPIFDLDGKEIGRHPGLDFFTIGQRRGLGVSASEPLYVRALDREKNALHLGRAENLESGEFSCIRLNWFGEIPDELDEICVQVRYRSQSVKCSLKREGNSLRVRLDTRIRSIAPGQSAVFYDGDLLLGGGIIRI